MPPPMQGIRMALTTATATTVAMLAGGVAPAVAAPPTCTTPPAATVRADTITPLTPACTPYFGSGGWTSAFTITDQPDHGTVTLIYYGNPKFRYLPAEGYEGPDAFSYRITTPDGDAGPTTQQVTVDAEANNLPTCSSWGAQPPPNVRAGGSRVLTASCTDLDGDPLAITVVTPPAHGTTTPGATTFFGREFTYTPTAGASGVDEFTVVAHDGRAASSPATLKVNVLAAGANTAPTCTAPGTSELVRNTPGTLAITCQDAEDDAFEIEIVTPPAHGTAEPAGLARGGGFSMSRTFAYLPADNHTGADSFTVRARDELGAASPSYPVPVQVGPPDLPTATSCPEPPSTVTVRAGAAARLAPQCFYVQPGAPEVISQPAHGTVRVAGGLLEYVPAAGYTGPDAFVYRILGVEGSGPRTMSLNVVAGANQAPSCTLRLVGPSVGFSIGVPPDLVVRAGATVPVRAACTDPEGDAVAMQVAASPHGTVGPLAPTILDLGETVARQGTYTPAPGFTGFTQLTMTGTDDRGAAASTWPLAFTVRHPSFNSPPACVSTGVSPVVVSGAEAEISVRCNDPEGDPVDIEVVDAPDHVTVGPFTPTADGNLVAAVQAPAGFTGVDRYSFQAVDDRGGRQLSPGVWFVRVIAPRAPLDVDAVRGESLGAEESALPTPARPANVRLRTLNEGRVTITTKSGTAPGGYSAFGLSFDITAPDAIPEVPLQLRFRFDASLLTGGAGLGSVSVFRDGALVPACTGDGATPNPCVAARRLVGGGDLEVVVRSVRAGMWSFGVASATPVPDVPLADPGIRPGPGAGSAPDAPVVPQGDPPKRAEPAAKPPKLATSRLPRLRAALSGGVRVGVTSPFAGTARATLVLDGRTAKLLKLSKGKAVTIAMASRRVLAGTSATLTARFTAKSRRALRSARSIRLTVRVAVGDGPPATRTITLKR